jgi:hypothetical protein
VCLFPPKNLSSGVQLFLSGVQFGAPFRHLPRCLLGKYSGVGAVDAND